MSCRDLQVTQVLRDSLDHQVHGEPMVKMEDQVQMVQQENEDLQDPLESVSIYQAHLVGLDKKETKEQKESLVFLVKMAILDHLELKENVADMHHLVNQVNLVDQANLVMMVHQESQEDLVLRDAQAKLLDSTKLKIKLLMASSHSVNN